jgi:hypothetical protein
MRLQSQLSLVKTSPDHPLSNHLLFRRVELESDSPASELKHALRRCFERERICNSMASTIPIVPS